MATDVGEKAYLSHTAQQIDDAVDAVATKASASDVAALQEAMQTLNGFLHTGELTDCNSAITSGIYGYSNTAENRPNQSGGAMFVIKVGTGAGYVKQIAIANSNSFTASNFVVFVRQSTSGGVFSDWLQFSAVSL